MKKTLLGTLGVGLLIQSAGMLITMVATPEAAAWAAPAGQVVDLRPKFTVGREVRLKLQTDETNSTTIPGQKDMDSTSMSKREMVVNLKCTAKTESGWTVDMKIESMRVSMTGGVLEGEFDSSKPATKGKDGDLAEALRPMVGSTMTLDVDKDGNVRSIKGNDAAQSAGAAAGNLTTVSGMQMLLSPMTSVTKTKPEAKVGEKWTTSDVMDTGMMGALKIETVYTLARVSGNSAEIPITGTITMGSEGANLGGTIKMKDSKYQGKVLWNTKDGMIESMDLDQSLSLEVGMSGANAQFQQHTKTKLTRAGR